MIQLWETVTIFLIREKHSDLFLKFAIREAAIYPDNSTLSSTQEGDLSIVEQSVKSGILKFGQITDIPVLVKLVQGTPSGSLISVVGTT